ncbi:MULTISPECIES: hypothetical protein [unclassified Colwellia]|jgi:hypothetical protein|uniref:hypothetical protein n=1 Tax=unclassified Colwellia TaxID=196834 RepID=UPI0015F4E041|nr:MULTISPECIES: hypothetical protein [unclassified Colwellia]MBA6255008.1 hypothetical protein [Colwellia sp. MB3u-28]MBA6259041.1 hypothetical protein [Colwellia sp. MB3u-41]MBA6262155.1 hypothetical protein [Colwellia sp. Bg11-12]
MQMISKDIFSRLLSTSGITTLTALSNDLGYNENWGTTTRKRGSIPYEACSKVSQKFNVSMDYLLYGIDNARKKMDINELKVSVTEGIFAAVQQEMITLNKGVKISTMANMITNEIIENCDIETQENIKKAI